MQGEAAQWLSSRGRAISINSQSEIPNLKFLCSRRSRPTIVGRLRWLPHQTVLARAAGDKTHDGMSHDHKTRIGDAVRDDGSNARCKHHPLREHRRIEVITRRADDRYDADEHS